MTEPTSVAALVRVLVVDSRAIVMRGLSELVDTGRPLIATVGSASTYGHALELADRLRPEVVVCARFQDPVDPAEAVRLLTHGSGAQVLILDEGEATRLAQLLEAGARGSLPIWASAEAIGREIIGVSHLAGDPAAVWIGSLAQLPMQVREQSRRHHHEHARLKELTGRERAVVRAILKNPSAKYITIGAMLGVGEHTVHNHLTSVYQKLNLTNRIELLVYATKHQGGALEDH